MIQNEWKRSLSCAIIFPFRGILNHPSLFSPLLCPFIDVLWQILGYRQSRESYWHQGETKNDSILEESKTIAQNSEKIEVRGHYLITNATLTHKTKV